MLSLDLLNTVDDAIVYAFNSPDRSGFSQMAS
jgi:hypothetical protein